MPILSKGGKKGEGFEPCPEGIHIARCVTVVDCGSQKTTWNGEDKWQEKVWIAFEVPAVRVSWKDRDDVEHEGPALIGQMYTNSIWEQAKLGQHLVGWRGKSFTQKEQDDGYDVSVLLDKPCQLSISHNPKKDGSGVYVNIVGIMGLPPGLEAPPRETDLTLYDPTSTEAPQVFNKLPKWLQDKCTFGHRLDQKEPERNEPPPQIVGYSIPGGAIGDGDFDDDIPF